jgi:hypothetical protein
MGQTSFQEACAFRRLCAGRSCAARHEPFDSHSFLLVQTGIQADLVWRIAGCGFPLSLAVEALNIVCKTEPSPKGKG